MNRTPLRQAEHEHNLEVSAARTPIIDAAVGRLEVQMEEVNARLDSHEEVLESLRDFFIELSTMLKKISDEKRDSDQARHEEWNESNTFNIKETADD